MGFMGGGQGRLHLTKPVVFLFLMGDGDGFEDDFVVALDAGEFETIGSIVVDQFLVVLAEGVEEPVDKDLGGARDERLTGDE